MCSKGKCLFCIKVETGALVLGVITSVLSGLLSLSYIGLLIAFNYMAYQSDDPNFEFLQYKISNVEYYMIIGNFVLSVALLKSLIDFLFAVLLCNGICKKNRSHVKAYFIYGVVMATLSGLSVFVVFWADIGAGLISLVLLGVYCLLLHMVNLALEKISTGEVYQFQHKRLVETVY